ncbi:MAG: DUF2341 domain-containing protein, partial [Bacteroidetes bacterium]|nr:DUF2341 domain-containing protein [Bacteroidota bacterium]
ATPAPGSTLKWYNAAVGGSISSAPAATAVGIYEAWAVSVSADCESARTKVTLTIFQACGAVVKDYKYAKGITILSSQVASGPHTDFPLLISFIDPDLRSVANGGKVENINGWDIVFTLNNATTKLDHQLERYVPTTGEYIAWVRIPTLSSAANTEIYMFYGNSAIVANQSLTSTWTAAYQAVYHFNNNFNDGTSNNRTGTSTITSDIAGIIGRARDFQDATSRIALGTWSVTGSNLTLSAWVKHDSPLLTNDPGIIAKANSATEQNTAWYIGHRASGGRVLGGRVKTGTDDLAGTNTYLGNTAWVANTRYYVAMTYDGSNVRLYVNGILESTTAKTGNLRVNTWNVWLGNIPNSTRIFDGQIDEPRVLSANRSTGWLLTEYRNQSSPSTFYVASVETTSADICQNGTPSGLPEIGHFFSRTQLCTDYTKVAGTSNLNDFPVLVDITLDTLKSTANGGAIRNVNGWDIAFTHSDGLAKLDFEIVSYNPTTGNLKAWVKIPDLSNDDETSFYLYFGAEVGVINPSSKKTWSNEYRAVWHMNNNTTGNITGSFIDATTNGHHATPFGFVADASTTGKVGQGILLNGTSSYFRVGPTANSTPANLNFSGENKITLSAWVNYTNLTANAPIIQKSFGTANNQVPYSIGRTTSQTRARTFTDVDGTGRAPDVTTGTALTAGTWNHIAMTMDGSRLKIFVNGVQRLDVSRLGLIQSGANEELRIGRNNATEYLSAIVDEVMVAGVARSLGWIQTEYNNQNNAPAFLVPACIGVESNPFPVTWLNFDGYLNNNEVKLNWSTASEIDAAYFHVQRSKDAISFETIGGVKANGNTFSVSNYKFTDPKPLAGVSYYRLKQVDYDGNFNFSKLVAVDFIRINGQIKIYPNPSKDYITIETTNESLGNVKLSDFSGRVIFEKHFDNSSSKIDLSSLVPGFYIITFNQTESFKIIKN